MGEIKRQSINNTLLSYIGVGIGFLLIYVQPHLISPSEIGLMRLLYTFSWMAAVVMPFGMGSITARFFPKIKNAETRHHGFFALLLLISSIGAFLIACILYLNKNFFVSYYKNSPEFPAYFGEAMIFAYILSLIAVYSVYASSLFKTTFTVFLTDVYTRIGQLVIVVIYYYGLIDKHTLILSYIGVFLLQLILLVLYLIRIRSVSFRINWTFYKTLNLKEIVYFGALMMFTAFASLGIKFIDQLLIGHFLNETLVGIYATCVMMSVVMEVPFNSLDRIAQPKIAHAWAINDVKEVEKIYELSSRYMFFAGAVLFCMLWTSLDLIFLFLPPEYGQGRYAFYLVSFTSLLNLLTGVNSSVIMLSHKYFATSILLFILIAVSFIANNLFIPPFGITGAAMGTLIAIGTFNILKYLYILIRFKMQPFSRHTFNIFLCILAALCLIWLLPESLHPFIRAVVGCVITGLVFSFMNIKTGAVEELNKLFRKFRLIS